MQFQNNRDPPASSLWQRVQRRSTRPLPTKNSFRSPFCRIADCRACPGCRILYLPILHQCVERSDPDITPQGLSENQFPSSRDPQATNLWQKESPLSPPLPATTNRSRNSADGLPLYFQFSAYGRNLD